VPRGVYALADPRTGQELGRERFSCAAGPSGWRYVGELTDAGGRPAGGVEVVLDAAGHQVRVEVRAGGWTLRGGVVGTRCLWVRAPGPAREQHEQATGFLGVSPAFLVALSRSPAGPGPRRLVEVAADTAAARPATYRWQEAGTARHETDLGPFDVVTHHLDVLDTGERRVVHVGGDVVLDAPGVELLELDSPPTRWPA
jgi:hypothetical protein